MITDKDLRRYDRQIKLFEVRGLVVPGRDRVLLISGRGDEITEDRVGWIRAGSNLRRCIHLFHDAVSGMSCQAITVIPVRPPAYAASFPGPLHRCLPLPWVRPAGSSAPYRQLRL